MTALFEGLDTMSLAEHVLRWSEADLASGGGAVSEWTAAAYTFAVRFEREYDSLSPAGWQQASAAWKRLIEAAERATGGRRNEWLLRDLRLSVVLLGKLGPSDENRLLDPHLVLTRALDAMPMSAAEARRKGRVWRELDKSEILGLRMIRQLLSCPRQISELLADDPRRGEFEEWQEVARLLP